MVASLFASTDVFHRILILGPRPGNSLTIHMSGATDGPVNPERVEVTDPQAMSQKIKELGRFLGADLVGTSKMGLEGLNQGSEVELDHRYPISVGIQMDDQRIKASPSHIDTAETGLAYSKVAKTVCQLAAYSGRSSQGCWGQLRLEHHRRGELR